MHHNRLECDFYGQHIYIGGCDDSAAYRRKIEGSPSQTEHNPAESGRIGGSFAVHRQENRKRRNKFIRFPAANTANTRQAGFAPISGRGGATEPQRILQFGSYCAKTRKRAVGRINGKTKKESEW